jgi:L-alanine-DL-glutamate epimerase-like enolase superfamily enzyme
MAPAIAEAEVIPYALPFKDVYRSAPGEINQREIVLLRIRSADGAIGLGEAVPLTLRGDQTLAGVIEELRGWAEFPDSPGDDLSGPARCAIDTALLDLEGHTEGVPVWSLLGAESATPVECNATLGAGEPLHVSQTALEWAGVGFRSFKLKVGVEGDLDVVALVRRAVGPDARLRVDANCAWDTDEAVDELSAMHQEGHLELAEQPCPSLEQLAEVRARVGIPIAGDESITGPEDGRRALEQGAVDMATAKISKVGGPRAALKVAAELPVYLSSALDGPVGIAAAGHTVQALPASGDAGVAHGLATQRMFAGTVAARHCEIDEGYLHLPDGPGLGVEIDDAALERHRL